MSTVPSTRVYTSLLQALQEEASYDKMSDENKQKFDNDINTLPIDDDALRLHIKKTLSKEAAQKVLKRAKEIGAEKDKKDEALKNNPPLSEEQQEKAEEILTKGNPLQYLVDSVKTVHVGDENAIKLLLLSGLSSGLKNRKHTIHLMTVGSSGKGKSSAQDHVSLCFDKVDAATSGSSKALLYQAKAEQLQNCGIIRFDEADALNSPEAIIIERALTDAGDNVPKHKTVSDDKKYVELSISQINSVWRASVDTPTDDQLLNRYLIINVDESPDQDNAVFDNQINSFCFGKTINWRMSERFQIAKYITNRIKEDPIEVIIPFGKLIKLSDKTNRRTLPKFLRVLWAIVYANRFQRQQLLGQHVATRRDFEMAKRVWKSVSLSEKTHVPERYNKLLSILPKDEENALDRKDMAFQLNLSVSAVYGLLKGLKDHGLITWSEADVITNLETKTKKTTKKVYWLSSLSEAADIDVNWSFIDDKTLAETTLSSLLANREEGTIPEYANEEERIKEFFAQNTRLFTDIDDIDKKSVKTPENNEQTIKPIGVTTIQTSMTPIEEIIIT